MAITPKVLETVLVDFKDPALVNEAFDFFKGTKHGELYAKDESPQYWMEKLHAGEAPEGNNPVFGLAVVVEKAKDAKDRIVGFVTHDFHLSPGTGMPVYHGIAADTDATKVKEMLQKAQRKDLSRIAQHHGTELHAMAEEIEKDGGVAFQNGKKLALDYAQPAWEEGKTANTSFDLNWHGITEAGKQPAKLAEHLDSFSNYFAGEPIAASADPAVQKMAAQVAGMEQKGELAYADTHHAEASLKAERGGYKGRA